MIFLGFFYYFKRIEKHIYFFSFPYGDLKQKNTDISIIFPNKIIPIYYWANAVRSVTYRRLENWIIFRSVLTPCEALPLFA
jgi:hypothetical protein